MIEVLNEIRAEQKRQADLLAQILDIVKQVAATQYHHSESMGQLRQSAEYLRKNTVSIATAPRSGF